MTPFLVFDDETGSFVNSDDIQGCIANEQGSAILVRGNPVGIATQLKPREVLRRASIIRYKRGLDGEEKDLPGAAAGGKVKEPAAAAVQ